MQADYTRKQQERVEYEQAFEGEFQQKEQSYLDRIKSAGSMEQELTQWREWYKSLEDKDGEVDDGVFGSDAGDDYGLSDDRYDKVIAKMNSELESLRNELSSVHTAVKNTGDRTSKMLGFHAQLDDLSAQYKGLDKQKLLDHALAKGETDLTRAYQDLYHDELVEAEVLRRLDEERATERTKGIHGPGRQVIIRPIQGAPKTFGEASEQILKNVS